MLDASDWDVHHTGLPEISDRDRGSNQAILDTDRNVLFNHSLAQEIKARNYLVAHSAGYTEYYQALCLQTAAEQALDKASRSPVDFHPVPVKWTPAPSYLSLLMCVPGSFDTFNSITSDLSDLPLAARQ
jgi:hypothetical protein